MKRLKLITVLLALLLAAAVIVPMVSATELDKYSVEKSAIDSVSIDVKTVQLPTLHSDKNAVIVDVSDEFVSDENIQSSQISEKLKSSNKLSSSKIPFGAIVKHSKNGITTIYDSTGKILFSVDDAKAPKIDTPNGLMPATFVHEVPDKSVIYDEKKSYTCFIKNSGS